MNNEFEEWKSTVEGKFMCKSFDLVTKIFSERTQKIIQSNVQIVFEAGQQSVQNKLDMLKCSYSLAERSKLNIFDKADRLKWYYMLIGDMDDAAKKDDLRDECLLELFEEIYSANRANWIPATEMLPEDMQICKFKMLTGKVFYGEYRKDTDQFKSIHCTTTSHCVESWQPLPEE